MAGSVYNRRLALAGLAAATIAAGLAWRFAIPGLPWFAWKYGGSALWAVLIYWLIAFAAPRAQALSLLLAGVVIVTLVELSRLWHPEWLDTFRLTLAGKLILGKVFSWWNLPAYYAGLVAACLMDGYLLRRPSIRR